MVTFHTMPPAFTFTSGEWPSASRLARHQALTLSSVTNLRHEQVNLDVHARKILGLLDGVTALDALQGKFRSDYPSLPDSAFTDLLAGLGRAGLLQGES